MTLLLGKIANDKEKARRVNQAFAAVGKILQKISSRQINKVLVINNEKYSQRELGGGWD